MIGLVYLKICHENICVDAYRDVHGLVISDFAYFSSAVDNMQAYNLMQFGLLYRALEKDEEIRELINKLLDKLNKAIQD